MRSAIDVRLQFEESQRHDEHLANGMPGPRFSGGAIVNGLIKHLGQMKLFEVFNERGVV